MDQAACQHTPSLRHSSSAEAVYSYLRKVLTHDRWMPISSGKVAREVGIAQSSANKAIQALAAKGRVLRQYGHGRRDACAYRLPKSPEAPKAKPVRQVPLKPSDNLSETIRNMRELERIMGGLPPGSASFNLLLKARGDLLRLTAALRSGNAAEAVERLGVLFEMVNPDLEETSIAGQMVLSAMQDFRAIAQ